MLYDLVILVILAVFVIGGVRRGAAKTLLSAVALIASAVLSVLLSRYISQFIFDAFIRASLEGKITEVLVNSAVNPVAQTATDIISAIPGFIVSAMVFFGIPQNSFQTFCEQAVTEKGELAATSITDAVMPVFTGVISTILCIVLFILLTIVLSKLAKLVSKVFRLPLIRVADSLLGGVLGLCEGLVTVTLILILLNLLLPLFPAQWTFLSQEYTDTSFVFRAINSGEIVTFVQQFTYRAEELINL